MQPGMTLFEGGNGAGKSNLIEAIYMLAVARSPRAATDRDLMRHSAIETSDASAYTQIEAHIEREGDPLRLQIHIRPTPNAMGAAVRTLQKYFRVNGTPRRASDLVGNLNAVMFSADDLHIVFGSPGVRRRYLNILISQTDRSYLRALQRYERVVRQRNHLLRRIRDGEARADETAFWDEQLVDEGARITLLRSRSVHYLDEAARPIYTELSSAAETMGLVYAANAGLNDSLDNDANEDPGDALERIAERMRQRLAERRQRELAQGVSVVGPHRDDLRMTLDGMDVAAFASRGQARSVVLAMKLAEAAYLSHQRRQEPVILLDDVLSELDTERRAQVIEHASRYRQALVTSADAQAVDERFRQRMERFVVSSGSVRRA